MGVRIEDRVGAISRPNLLGAIISKAAAFAIPKDAARVRHLSDIGTLLAMSRPEGRIYEGLTKSDKHHLRKMEALLRGSTVPGVDRQTLARVTQYLESSLDTIM